MFSDDAQHEFASDANVAGVLNSWFTCIRRMPLASVKTCGELCINFMKMIYDLSGRSNCIDFIFDIYLEKSVKDSERVRRSISNPIHVNEVGKEAKLPVSKDAFWASSENKSKLQEALHLQILGEQNEKTELVVSAVGEFENLKPCIANMNACSKGVPRLNLEIEEADFLLIPHALNAVQHGAARTCILSDDTDVVVLGI